MNIVDCSPETVETHWRRIRVEHKITVAQDFTQAESEVESEVEQTVNIGSTEQPEHITGAEWANQKQDILSRWISKGLQAVFVSMLKLDVSTDAFDDFAGLTAEMLGKYHPNLSAFEIIAKFERELMWGYAALMLTVAIVKGFRQKSLEKKSNKMEVVEGELVNDYK